MGWLRTRIQSWRRQARGPEGGPASAIEAGRPSCESARPPLVLLVPDAVGLTSFRPYTFDDAQSAAAFVDFWYPTGVQPQVIAFWALQDEPLPGAESLDAEVVVLIRDPDRPGTVHLFSFVDMDVARSFVRLQVFEGTDLGLFMVYWAALVRIEIDKWGAVRLSSQEPPPTIPRPAQPEEERPAEQSDIDPSFERLIGELSESSADDTGEAELRLISRALKNRRWEERDGPFQGFGSPPGKF